MKKLLSKFNYSKNEGGFTFIEILASLIVLAIGILSVIAVSTKSYTSVSLERNKLIATNLAREGIEMVRYIRNKNWLSVSEALNGKSDCDGNGNISACPNGQVEEDGGDCDWRCGDEEFFSPSYRPQFKLGAPVNGEYLADIEDYSTEYGNNRWIITTTNSPLSASEGNCESMIGDREPKDWMHFPYARLIIITRGNKDTGQGDLNGDGNYDNDLLVQVIVCWREKGRLNSVSTEEQLYNWKR